MKTVLITGATRGLGLSLTKVFLTGGYHLILNSRNIDPSMNDNIDIVKGDLADNKTISELAKIARQRNVDVLINNAAIYQNKQFNDMSERDYRHMMETNLAAPIRLTKAIWSIFRKNVKGHIININSVAGKHGSSGESAYCAAKFGFRGFSQSLHMEGAKFNIRIIDVFLGAMKTDMTAHRHDHDNLIDPDEAAKAIYALSDTYKTLNISEIEFKRVNY